MTRTDLITELKRYFRKNPIEWSYIVDDLDKEDRFLDFEDIWMPMDCFDDYFECYGDDDKIDKIIKEYDGDKNGFSYGDNYFRINDYGLESCDYPDYRYLLKYPDDIIDDFINYCDNLDGEYYYSKQIVKNYMESRAHNQN